VTQITGTCASAGCWRIQASSPQPPSPGICKSSSTASGGVASRLTRACAALSDSTTV